MKRIGYLLVLFIGLSFFSCEELENILGGEENGLTESEVIEGLKTALHVGTDTAVSVTSQINGYYKDEAIKILLPDEAQVIYDHMDHSLVQTLGIDDLLEDAVLSINRAAEHAASDAAPILKDAIVSLSISDGWDILNGKNPAQGASQQEAFDSTAATHYLIATAQQDLFNAFQPKINTSLEKDLLGNLSTKEIWEDLTDTYNTAAQTLGWETVETQLDVYVTREALDGLFYKVGQEEKDIRRDPAQWAGTTVEKILKKVFSAK